MMNMTNLKRLIVLNLLFVAALGLSTVNARLVGHEESEAEMVADIETKTLDELSGWYPPLQGPYLQQAAHQGYANALRKLIAKGVNVNDYDQDKEAATALYCAAEEGHRSCVIILLRAGADPMIWRDRATPAARDLVDSCVHIERSKKKKEIAHEIDRQHRKTHLPANVRRGGAAAPAAPAPAAPAPAAGEEPEENSDINDIIAGYAAE